MAHRCCTRRFWVAVGRTSPTRSRSIRWVTPMSSETPYPRTFRPCIRCKVRAETATRLSRSSTLKARCFCTPLTWAARAIAVNSAGDAYVAGYTVSTNFPVLHAYQGTIDGGQDAFVVQIGGASALALLSISPDAGSTGGNTAITLSGANFEAGAAVTIGGLAASNVNVVSGATITALTPARSPGPVDVSVTNPDAGTATLPMAYTYVDSKGNSSGGSTKGGCSASASASPIWIGLAALALSLAAARRRR